MILTQNDSGSLFSINGLMLIIIFMSLAVCGWLAVRYRNIRSFEFQILIFITTYVVGEIVEDYKMPLLSAFPYIGSQIHIASAVLLAIILWLRLYSARKGGRSMIDKVEPSRGRRHSWWWW
jgi:hypothetical protein